MSLQKNKKIIHYNFNVFNLNELINIQSVLFGCFPALASVVVGNQLIDDRCVRRWRGSVGPQRPQELRKLPEEEEEEAQVSFILKG